MTAPHDRALRVGMEPAASAGDPAITATIAGLVNGVYAEAEAGLWGPGAERTSPDEIAEFLRSGEIATARSGDEILGSVRVRLLDADTAELGMLAADPERRGIGIGRDLVRFAEAHAAERGARTMQLELLVPVTWSHPSKEFLRGWYERIGYRVVRTGHLAEFYPELAPLLATECDLLIYRKPLDAAPA